MSIFNPVARTLWSGGGQGGLEAELREVEQAYEKLKLFAHPYEIITEDGTDGIGDYVFVTQEYTPNPSRKNGYFRLKPGVKEMANLQAFYGESYDLTEMTQETRRRKHDGTYGTISVASGAMRASV